MTTLEEFALPLAEHCVAVPPSGAGVCPVCHTSCGTFSRCFSCNEVPPQLAAPCPLVVPVSLCRKAPTDPKEVATGSQLYYWLKRYKTAADPKARHAFRVNLMGILALFLKRHIDCLTEAAGGVRPEVLTVVPSTKPERIVHPLHETLSLWDGIILKPQVLLRLGPGEMGTNKAADDGFLPTQDVAGVPVLVVDDTFTSGATAQSAASALTLAGANVVAIVPIGRMVTPDYNEATAAYWKKQLSQPFSFGSCCLEG